MNKNTKICLNYLAGGAISILLLYSIYAQVNKQSETLTNVMLRDNGPAIWLVLGVALMAINSTLECFKWHLLINSVEPINYPDTIASYLAGIAISIITPNRIGEYPARILFLGRTHTFRYVNVSVLGIMAQLSAIYIIGFTGLLFYNIAFPSLLAKAGLAACIIVNLFLGVIYWKFEDLLPGIAKIQWLKRFVLYGKLLNRVTTKRQILVLGVSVARCIIFTAQYLFLLRWLNVNVPLAEGFFTAALFFWVMAVIPGIALTEIGIRGKLSLLLFQVYSPNAVGIIEATVGIWIMNLIVPSIIGSILILRMRLLK